MKPIPFLLLLFCFCTSAAAQSDRYQKQLNDKYTSGLFRTDNAYLVVPLNDPAAIATWNIFQYLQGRVPGLEVWGAYGPSPRLRYRMSTPTYFLDEVRVDAQILASVPVTDIALVKVFRTPFPGAFGANGAVAVYTKDGDEE